MEPSRIMQFLGFIINSKSMAIFLPEEKKKTMMHHCKTFLNADEVSLREIARVLVTLTSAYQAVLPDHSIIGHFRCNK